MPTLFTTPDPDLEDQHVIAEIHDGDAVAAVDDEPPLTEDEATWREIVAYRRVLTYVLNVATEPGFVIDEAVLRDERTATRDLVKAAELGLLEARGERRGRHYVAGEPLRKVQEQLRAERKPLEDPYASLLGEIRRALP